MKQDLRGQHLSPRTCEVCGATYQPKMAIQETCGQKCAQKKKNARRTAEGYRKVGYDNRQRFYHGASYKVVEAPPIYYDYIGLMYGSIEFEASLHMGSLPPGVTVESNGKRFLIVGEPSPLEVALTGNGTYNHQKKVKLA